MPRKPSGRPPGNPKLIAAKMARLGIKVTPVVPKVFEERKRGPVRLMVRIGRCAEFMEKEGWALLEEQARQKGSKNQMPALNTLSAYGYGKPSESIDLTSGGKSMDVASFLLQPEGAAEDSGGTMND